MTLEQTTNQSPSIRIESSTRSVDRLSRAVARNSTIGLSAQVAIKILSFGFSVLVIRRLGAEAYGQYAAVLAFGAVFVILADLGLGPFAIREVASWRELPDGEERTSRLYGNILALRFVLSLVTAGVIVGSAWLTGRSPMVVGAIALGTLGLVMYSIQGAAASMLAGFERLDLTSGSQVVYQLAFVTIGGAALYLGTGYYGLIVANLIGIALITAICWSAVRRLGIQPGWPSARTWAALLQRSMPFAIIGFTLGLSYKFDSLLLNIYRGDAETGYYNAAYNLVFSVVVLSNVLNTSLFPSLIRQAAADPEVLPRIYERALGYLMVLSLPMTIGIWMLADKLVPLLFSASYDRSIPALEIVIWVTPLMFASEFLGYIVVVQGNAGRVARAIMVSTLLNVAINLFLVPRFGLYGAAAMTVATEVVLVAQYVWVLRALLRNLNWDRILARPLGAATAMGLALAIGRALPLPILVATGALVYVSVLLALRVVGKDEIDFIRRMRAHV